MVPLATPFPGGQTLRCDSISSFNSVAGCLLHDDAVIDVTALRATPPLQAHFDTPADLLPIAWFRRGIQQLRCRAMSTFTVLPGTTAQPIALSPGGRCISFDRIQRRISFASRPIGVAGRLAAGRVVLLGGPHIFETGTYGLLDQADNRQFLDHVLRWLWEEGLAPYEALSQPIPWCAPELTDENEALNLVDGGGNGGDTVASVERVLRKTGVLKALGRAKCLP